VVQREILPIHIRIFRCKLYALRMAHSVSVKAICLLAFALFISSSNSQLSTYFSKNEISSIKASAMVPVNKPTSLNDAYHATKVLESTKATGFACNCGALGSLLKDASSSLDIYYGVAASNNCGCGLNAPSDAKSIATSGLTVSSWVVCSWDI
jgi:Oligosaccharyltransferase subunit Ribophorin II